MGPPCFYAVSVAEPRTGIPCGLDEGVVGGQELGLTCGLLQGHMDDVALLDAHHVAVLLLHNEPRGGYAEPGGQHRS